MRILNKKFRLTNVEVRLCMTMTLLVLSFSAPGKCSPQSAESGARRCYDVIAGRIVAEEKMVSKFEPDAVQGYIIEITYSFRNRLTGIQKIFDGGACDIPNEPGKNYLLFIQAYEDEYTISMCDDNNFLGRSGENIAFLNKFFGTDYQLIKPDFIIFITMIMFALSGLSWIITRHQFHFRSSRNRKTELLRVSVTLWWKNVFCYRD